MVDPEKAPPLEGADPAKLASGDTVIQVPPPKDGPAVPDDPPSDSDASLTPAQRADKARKAEEERQRAVINALPPVERDIILSQIDVKTATVSFFRLYKYATTNDLIIVAISTIAAIATGVGLPLMALVFGDLTNEFGKLANGGASGDTFTTTLNRMVLYFVYLGIATFVASYISTVGFLYTGEHVACQIRQRYLRALLRQNVGFYDQLGAGEITTRITTQTTLVQDGISEKISSAITGIATFIGALVVAFARNWKFTLILISIVFALAVVMGIGGARAQGYMDENQKVYGEAGAIAEEVISSVRTATAFGIQKKLADMYNVRLAAAQKSGFRFESSWSYIVSGMFLVIYLSYGLAFWEGSRLLVSGDINLGDLLIILMGIILGAFAIGNAASTFKNAGQAVEAAVRIYSTIERDSPIDPLSDQGHKPAHMEGNVELRNVRHIYPSRPDAVVMDNVSLVVPAGKTTALVGPSGSGKSTIVGLIERFYNPVGGQILIDGHDIADLNLRWLRQHIALVGQEPVLFSTSIAENIRYGLPAHKTEGLSDKEVMDLVVDAAKKANAHDFISLLPQGYETQVGERGMLLSGGQKQRIAIARAIISDPKILLLDEATSALDTKSEGVVQAALDQAAESRTTIVIAHRLSTIKNADNIVVMSEGRIVEQGTHDELLALQGMYYALVEGQKVGGDEDLNEAEASPSSSVESLPRKGVEPVPLADPADEELQNLSRQATTKSKASVALEKDAEKGVVEKKYSLSYLIRTVARYNKSEWHYMLLGFLACVICGAGQPVQAVFYAKSVSALSLPPSQYGELRREINFWAWMFFMLAWVVFIAFIVDGVAFAWCSVKLTRRVRDLAFRAMLRQEIAFFDEDSNSTGSLTAFLSTQAQLIAGMSGATLGTILMGLCTLVISIVIAVALAWKLGLVMTATIPILLGCGFLRFYLLIVFETACKEAYNASAAYACETAASIRTVASLSREEQVWKQYNDSLEAQMSRSLRSNLKASSLFAASQSLNFFCFALGFWYGGKLMVRGEYSFFQFFVSYTAIIFGAQSAGNVLSFVPDMGKARNATLAMCKLLDRQPKIDWWAPDGVPVKTPDVRGVIEFRDVHFRYPTRPKQPVLRGLSFTANPGEFIALVGASGCGKSTTIQLIERFYDPLAGQILLDGRDVREYNLSDYRSTIALVSQEPTLYQSSILENIKMGADREVTMDEVVKACQEANIYDFIQSLSQGFNTLCGPKATLLSGGQKQRIAIARALIRNPRVLLLDEATSALDSTSEQVVQQALDQAAKGRTTVAIAHRLSTIQHADRILVVDRGRVVEEGRHHELMAKGGMYAELVRLQGLDKTGN